MTDFTKVEKYYKNFDEWNRTFTPEGLLEFEISLNVIKKYTKEESNILDLGGGPGRYTHELAKCGRIMSLGDISPELIAIAKEKNRNIKNIKSIDVVNAIDLNLYENNSFDAVLNMGPLYHLTNENEIIKSLKEIYRILRPNGIIIAAFIPFLSGTAGIIERSIFAPNHVTSKNLIKLFETGIFNNNSDSGFQEGKYLKSNEIQELMNNVGFKKEIIRSVRGLGYKIEKGILEKKESNPELFNTIMRLIDDSSEDNSIVNTCGHALYIGKKSD